MSFLSLSRSLTRLAPRQALPAIGASSSTTTTSILSFSTNAVATQQKPYSYHYNKTAIHSFHSTPLALFSDTNDDDGSSFSAKDELMDILAREHAEEMENDSMALPAELQELKDELASAKGGSWKIMDAPDSAMTKMIKTTAAGMKVQVSFHCQDTVEVGFDDGEVPAEEEPATDEEAEQDDDEASVPLRFTVLTSKAGQSLLFTCLTEQGVAQIQSVAMAATPDSSAETDLLNNGSVPAEAYQGPEFVELAQDLQYAFQNFLEQTDGGLGINEDVAAFIAMYADYKEQSQYVKFLEKAKGILS